MCFVLGEFCVCVLFSSIFILFLRAEGLDAGFGLCFLVLALVFVFMRCFGEFCMCVLDLWGFGIREETPATTPFLSAPRKCTED